MAKTKAFTEETHPGKHQQYTRENYRLLVSMWRDGSSENDIAVALGRTIPSIRQQITGMRKKGIKMPKRGGQGGDSPLNDDSFIDELNTELNIDA